MGFKYEANLETPSKEVEKSKNLYLALRKNLNSVDMVVDFNNQVCDVEMYIDKAHLVNICTLFNTFGFVSVLEIRKIYEFERELQFKKGDLYMKIRVFFAGMTDYREVVNEIVNGE